MAGTLMTEIGVRPPVAVLNLTLSLNHAGESHVWATARSSSRARGVVRSYILGSEVWSDLTF